MLPTVRAFLYGQLGIGEPDDQDPYGTQPAPIQPSYNDPTDGGTITTPLPPAAPASVAPPQLAQAAAAPSAYGTAGDDPGTPPIPSYSPSIPANSPSYSDPVGATPAVLNGPATYGGGQDDPGVAVSARPASYGASSGDDAGSAPSPTRYVPPTHRTDPGRAPDTTPYQRPGADQERPGGGILGTLGRAGQAAASAVQEQLPRVDLTNPYAVVGQGLEAASGMMSPLPTQNPLIKNALNIYSAAVGAFGGEVGRDVGRAMGLSDQAMASVGGIGVSPQDVAAFAGSTFLDPTTYVGGGSVVGKGGKGLLNRAMGAIEPAIGRAVGGGLVAGAADLGYSAVTGDYNPERTGTVVATGAGTAALSGKPVRDAAGRLLEPVVEAGGKVVRGLGEAAAERMLQSPLVPRMIQETGGGSAGRQSPRLTVEVLRERIDKLTALRERARAAGDAETEADAAALLDQYRNDLIDAMNARLDLEPRIESDIGRRIENVPPDPGSIDRSMDATYPRERVASPGDVPTTRVEQPGNSMSLNMSAGGLPGGGRTIGRGGAPMASHPDALIFSDQRILDSPPNPHIAQNVRRLADADGRAPSEMTPDELYSLGLADAVVAAERSRNRIPARAGRRYYHVVDPAYVDGEPLLPYSELQRQGRAPSNKWEDDFPDYPKSPDARSVTFAESYPAAYAFNEDFLNGKGVILAVDVPPGVRLRRNGEGYVMKPGNVPPEWVSRTSPQAVDIPRGEPPAGMSMGGLPPATGADDIYGRAARALSEPLVGGLTGAIVNSAANPDDPNAARTGAIAGAVGIPLATRGIRAVASRAGADMAEGAGTRLGMSLGGLFGRRPTNQGAAAAQNPVMQNMARMMNTPHVPGATNARGWLERWAQAMTDDRAGLRNLQEAVSRTIGRPLQAGEMVAELTRRNPASIAGQRLRDELRPALLRVGDDDDYLAQYLVHSHNVDVAREIGQQAYDAAIAAGRSPQQASQAAMQAANTRRFAGDLTLTDTQQQLQDIAQRVQSLPDGQQRWQAIQDAAQTIWDMNRRTLERKRDAGIISPALFNELTQRYPRYVRTDIADYFDKGAGAAAGGGPNRVGVSNIGIQKISAAGSAKERVNPLLSTIDQTYSAESSIARNEAGKAFEELLRLDPNWQQVFREVVPSQGVNVGNPTTTVPSGYTLRNGEQFLRVWQNGTARTFVVPKEYAAIVSPQTGRVLGDNVATNAWRGMMNVYKSLITSKNPSFAMLVSPVRDAGDYAIREATMSAEHGGIRGAAEAVGALPRIMLDYARAVPDAFAGILDGTYKGDLARMMREGAGQGSRPRHDITDLRQAYNDLRRTNGLEVRSAGDLMRIAGNALTLGAEPIGGRLEQVPRLAAARRAARRGAGNTEQAMAFRDATVDFQRAGEWARAINEVVPFFNVAMQGGAQTVRTATKNPAAFLAATAATLGSAAVAAEAWNRSDAQRASDYEDVPDYLKRSGIVLMLPGVEGRSERGDRLPNYLWVPVGQYGALVQTAREAIQKTAAGEGGPDLSTPTGWGELGSMVGGIFSPLRGDSAGAALTSLIPPGLSTAADLTANKDLYRGSTIATEPKDETASVISQGSAAVFNRLTGQETRPSQWEHAYRDLGGYAATVGMAGANMAAEALGVRRPKDEDRPVQSAPMVGGLVNRVVRDAGGQRLETAQDDRNRVPEGVRDVLGEVGLRRDQITAVPSRYKGAQLTREEQERWQDMTNTLLAREMAQVRRDPKWRSPSTREQAVKDAVSRAKQTAAERALRNLTDAEVQRRLRREQSRKAS